MAHAAIVGRNVPPVCALAPADDPCRPYTGRRSWRTPPGPRSRRTPAGAEQISKLLTLVADGQRAAGGCRQRVLSGGRQEISARWSGGTAEHLQI